MLLLTFLGLKLAFGKKTFSDCDDISIHSVGGNKYQVRSDDDSLSPTPKSFRSPLKHRVAQSMKQSKLQSIRMNKIRARQRVQAYARILCHSQFVGYMDTIDQEDIDLFIKSKINEHALGTRISAAVQSLSSGIVLSYFAHGGTIVDLMINHFKYAMDILLNAETSIFDDAIFWKGNQYQVSNDRSNNSEGDGNKDLNLGVNLTLTDIIDKVIRVFADPSMIGRLIYFNQTLVDNDYEQTHAWNGLQEKKESIGYLTVLYWLLRALVDLEICSREVTSVVKGRSKHKPRSWPFSDKIEKFFRESLDDPQSFFAKVLLDTDFYGDEMHIRHDHGFDLVNDIEVQLKNLIPNDEQLQYQYVQHIHVIQLCLDAISPLLPYFYGKLHYFNISTLGAIQRDFKMSCDKLTRLIMYKTANQMDGNNARNKNNSSEKPSFTDSSGRCPRARGRPKKVSNASIACNRTASPEDRIIHAQEQNWSITTANIANTKMSGCKKMDHAVNLAIDNSILINPLPTAIKTFSKYHIDRSLREMMETDGIGAAVNKDRIITRVRQLHDDGFHRLNDPALIQMNQAFVNTKLELLQHPFTDGKFKCYNDSFRDLKFWKYKEIRKQCWKEGKLKHMSQQPYILDDVFYGIGWQYSSDLQYVICHSDEFQQTIPIMTKYLIAVPQNSLIVSTMVNWDPELHGYTSSGSEEEGGDLANNDHDNNQRQRASSVEPFVSDHDGNYNDDDGSVAPSDCKCKNKNNCNCAINGEIGGQSDDQKHDTINVVTKRFSDLDLSLSEDGLSEQPGSQEESDSDVDVELKKKKQKSQGHIISFGGVKSKSKTKTKIIKTTENNKFANTKSSLHLSMQSNDQPEDNQLFNDVFIGSLQQSKDKFSLLALEDSSDDSDDDSNDDSVDSSDDSDDNCDTLKNNLQNDLPAAIESLSIGDNDKSGDKRDAKLIFDASIEPKKKKVRLLTSCRAPRIQSNILSQQVNDNQNVRQSQPDTSEKQKNKGGRSGRSGCRRGRSSRRRGRSGRRRRRHSNQNQKKEKKSQQNKKDKK